jgi:hypothetical protein
MSMDLEPFRPRRWWAIFAAGWCLVLIVVFALQQWQVFALRQYERDKAAAELAYQAVKAKWNTELCDPSKNYLAYSGLPARRSPQDPATRQQLRERLFPGRSPAPPPSYMRPPADGVVWDDPVRDLVFVIHFANDDTWRSFQTQSRERVLWADGPMRHHPLLQRLEPICRAWVGRPRSTSFGIVLWVALTLAALLPTRFSLGLARAQLAVAWLCLLGWLIAIDYPLTPDGIASNVAAGWGVLLVIVSGATLHFVKTRPKRRWRDPRFCVKCGYDLTGNLSGVCPECGLAVTSGRRGRPARLRVSVQHV